MNIMKRIALSIVIAALILSSCTEEIELNLTPEEYSRLIVEGQVTDLYPTQTVVLRKTAPYDSNQPNPPAEGAFVTINDGNNTYLLSESSPGVYETDEFLGEVGRIYTLNIDYEEESYSAISKMHKTLEIDSIRFTDFPFGIPADLPHINVLIYGQDCETPDQHYLFQYSVNGNWDNHFIDDAMAMYSDALINGSYISAYNIGVIETMEEVIEVQVRSLSISEEYVWFLDACTYNYMPNMFFSPPKANVQGNISNGALGFFNANSIIESDVYTIVVADLK
jgi:hypothetical protein